MQHNFQGDEQDRRQRRQSPSGQGPCRPHQWRRLTSVGKEILSKQKAGSKYLLTYQVLRTWAEGSTYKWCGKLLELPWSSCPHWVLEHAVLCLCSRNPLAHSCLNHCHLLSSRAALSVPFFAWLPSYRIFTLEGASPPPMKAYLNWLTFTTRFNLRSHSAVHKGRGFNISL